MMRVVMRPWPLAARSFVAGRATRPLAPVAARAFAAKPKVEDGTLEGRYATALFMATGNKLDKVYQDLAALRSMIQESPDLKLMVETPGIDPDSKVKAIRGVCQSSGIDETVENFMKVLIEN